MASSKFTLGKEERLKSRKLIEGLFREGKSFALYPFRVYYETGPAGGVDIAAARQATIGEVRKGEGALLQAGFGAGTRNFKKAVDRNRIKRLTREAYRLQKNGLQDHLEDKGWEMAAFFIYTGKELPDQDTVMKKMGSILQKLIKETGG